MGRYVSSYHYAGHCRACSRRVPGFLQQYCRPGCAEMSWSFAGTMRAFSDGVELLGRAINAQMMPALQMFVDRLAQSSTDRNRAINQIVGVNPEEAGFVLDQLVLNTVNDYTTSARVVKDLLANGTRWNAIVRLAGRLSQSKY